MAGYQTGTGNELLSDGIYNYTYDADGNMTSQTNIATGSVTYYTWDYRNRLVEVKQEDNHNNVLNDEKFTYDVFNNRIAVSLNGTPQLYTVYDGANPYLDFNSNGQLTERYLTNPNALSQFYGQVNANGAVQWFLTDNIHSIRQVVNSSGSVLDALTYDPYGNIVSQTNAANAPRFLYAGGAYDPLTGYDQFGRRYYDPADGRWTSQDPLGFAADDSNLYRYVGNNPTNVTDPSGLFDPWNFTKGLAAGFGSGIADFFGGLWNMIRHPWDTAVGIYEGAKALIAHLANFEWDDATKQLFPELYQLATQWSTLSDHDKGYLIGKVLGQYGSAALTTYGIIKIVKRLKAAKAANAPKAPLAGVLEGHPTGQGFTGVFDSSTGKIALNPSTDAPVLPPGFVPRRGGHADVSRALGGNPANHSGFAVILQEDGTLRVTWRSGTLNNTPDSLVPVEQRPAIIKAIEEQTGRKVCSY